MSSAALQNKANAAEIVTAVLPKISVQKKQDITKAHSQRTHDYTQISSKQQLMLKWNFARQKCLQCLQTQNV
jgi:hypothetical protein